jgi:hypothetical protein
VSDTSLPTTARSVRPGPDAGTPVRPWLRWALGVLATAVLLLVFMAYLTPHLALDLATRLWACF